MQSLATKKVVGNKAAAEMVRNRDNHTKMLMLKTNSVGRKETVGRGALHVLFHTVIVICW